MSKPRFKFGGRTLGDRLSGCRRTLLHALKETTLHVLTLGGVVALGIACFLGMSLGSWCLPLLIGSIASIVIGLIGVIYLP